MLIIKCNRISNNLPPTAFTCFRLVFRWLSTSFATPLAHLIVATRALPADWRLLAEWLVSAGQRRKIRQDNAWSTSTSLLNQCCCFTIPYHSVVHYCIAAWLVCRFVVNLQQLPLCVAGFCWLRLEPDLQCCEIMSYLRACGHQVVESRTCF